LRLWLVLIAAVAVILPSLTITTVHAQALAPAVRAATPPPPTSSVKLQVQSARNGSSGRNAPRALQNVNNYRWLINLDNTGRPEQGNDNPLCHPSTNRPGVQTPGGYPEGCYWPSVRFNAASPALSEGTQTDWNRTKPLPTFDGTRGLPDKCDGNGNPVKGNNPAALTAVPCKYLVSVAADGYQLGGSHFTVPNASGTVRVFLNPYPVPLGTIRIKVFNDNGPADGTFDEQTEPGLVGFLGIVSDFDGQVSADYFGNPLCTQYQTNSAGQIVLNSRGQPTPLPARDPAPPGPSGYFNPTVPGRCLSDTNGDIVIPNMAPNHYTTEVTPPDADNTPGHRWIQTTTLEGAHDHDVWIMPNDTGLDTELVVGGEAVPWVQFGFSKQAAPPDTWACPSGGIQGQTAGCGQIKGQLFGAIPYVPGIGALPGVGGANGNSGLKLDRPIDRGWVAINSLDASTGDFDRAVASFPTNADGSFTVNNVPDGDYFLTIWDEPQDYALDRFNVTISHGQVVDMGVLPLLGWFTRISGHVFIDKNGNGRQDPGEQGLFHGLVQNLNRTNNAMEGGINTTYTDNSGYYEFTEAYPLGLMSINQFFVTRFKTSGVTWQACNDPQEHTIVAPMVDVSYLPVIGHCGRLDWGIKPYDASSGENGGIVATMLYDEIRTKFNARQAQSYDYQTGIPGFRFEQYSPVKGAGPGGTDPLTGYALNADGSYQTVQPLQPSNGKDCSTVDPSVACYQSEANNRPAQCYPRDANGNPIGFDPADPRSLDFYTFGGACIETGAQSTQFGLGTDNPNPPVNHPVQTVDGNYGFGGPPGDTLIRATAPVDTVLPPDPNGNDLPLYKTTTEQDVNLFSAAQFIPQNADKSNVAWPPNPGPAHQMPTGNIEENPNTTSPGPDPICAGSTFKVHVSNRDTLANGGSPLEGQTRHLCDTKLLNIQAGQSSAPNFHVRTVVDIPLPTHFSGYIVDDISVATNRKSTAFGEVQGIPGVPIGIYDWTGRRNYSVNSDYNGVWEVLMPSAEIFNCPTPAQTCPNVYRFVGNDPGQPGRPNLNYNPSYRTISANFQAWPNMLVPADTAPTRVVTSVEAPGAQFTAVSPCGIKQLQPQLFAVSPAPYSRANEGNKTVTIDGANFGASGRVEFTPESTGVPIQLPQVGAWTDNQVRVRIGNNVTVSGKKIPAGAGMLHVIQNVVDPVTHVMGTSTTNGVTFHVFGTAYNPHVIEVGYHKQIDPFQKNAQGKFVHPFAIQDALDLAAQQWQAWGAPQVANGRPLQDVANDPNGQYLVVVYPHWNPARGQNQSFVPFGTYFENLIVHSPVKLQGVGPGGAYKDGTGTTVAIQGSVIDGRFFSTMTSAATDGADTGEGGVDIGPSDPGEPMVQHWVQLLEAIQTSTLGTGLQPVTGGIAWSGVQQPLGEGAVVTVLGTTGTYNTKGFNSAIDGFTISGGDQNGLPGNLNEVAGTKTGPFPEPTNTDEAAGAIAVQGGAVYVNGGTDNYRITNNSIRQNSGSYGAVRFGTLFQSDPALEGGMSHNWNAAVSHNAFVANGGTNLAGAVGLFTDTKNYSIDHNTFCMNASAEYGGAISHHGYSPGGKISYNRMFLNTAFDEGGAITIASEPAFKVFTGPDIIPIPDPAGFTQGTGDVSIDHNYIGDNLAQDDGGALRIMGTAGTRGLSPITITNNMITNNVSAHEGAALSLFDAPVLNLVNNTIAKNITTATAVTSNGSPAPGGVSTGLNSAGLNTLLQSTTEQPPAWMNTSSWPTFSNALVQNDVFWDNRAGSWTPNGVGQIGQPGDTAAINRWDVGSVDGAALLTVSNSVLNTPPNAPNQGYIDGGGNKVSTDPAITNFPNFAGQYDSKISVVQMRTYFRFRPSAILSVDLPDNALGDYHLNVPSPAQAMGKNPPDGGVKVTNDVDNRARPAPPTATDAGAHQAGGQQP